MTLLVDLGNTRLKLAQRVGSGLSEIRAVAHHGDPARAFAALDTPPGMPVRIASVFEQAANERFAEQIRAQHPQIHFVRSEASRNGLRNVYAEPQRLGVDRWLAMLALWTELRGACCIVSAGTALTVDLVDSSGQHLGGYIAPGLVTQQQAVLGATRFEHRDTRAPYRNEPGNDTESCVREAALAAALGLIEHSTRDFDGLRVLVGGDADILRPHLNADWQTRPDLVLRGLAAVDIEP